jgi:acyl-CoA dehydrogenase
MSAMQATGLSGYRNDTPFSIGRHLRDILSAPIMINNERILSGVALTSLVAATPPLLRDADETRVLREGEATTRQATRSSIA